MDHTEALHHFEQLYAHQPEQLSKQVRIELALRQAITHQWPTGLRLPSHRALASAVGVSRQTLAQAVGTLLEEQLLKTAHGQGTWTCKPAVLATTLPVNTQLSKRAQRVLDGPGASMIQSGAFVPGIPDIAQFPMRKWRQLYASVTVPQNALLLSYSTGGYGPLKRAIRDFLARWRNISCDTEQIIITDGTHNGIQLCAMALADVGDTVAMESPCYWGARNVFTAAGLDIQMLAWQPGNGHSLPSDTGPIKLAYLTGSHHYPLSVPTSAEHKQQLCDALSPSYVVEDDYEFNRDDHANLLFDAHSARHLLVGSFSKMMFPGLRLGYLVVPHHLAGPMNRLRSELFREGRMLDQAVLAQFIFDGDLDAWCRRIQRDYLGRQQVLHDQLGSLPQVRSVSPPSSAISLCVEFEPGINDVQIAQALLKEHLVVRPLSPVCAKHDPRVGLVMGVGMLSGETLVREAQRLRRCLESLLR
ncbi:MULTISPECIES: aminotransferase-like domain-containing protein [unclassified Halomonas]|uniref:aminotransferase-like domain-containing protein n=1 Tax=unclassified Halomonas TaxID=2609666 RepID=UPI0006D97D6B|nr:MULTISPECIES: PLP-dependent aminotransferase family protein [unclassified Halomonas]KPQ21859.1 MAG: bifunctional GntR family transcriptional regulator / MocR family aminotransferase [Halomonas sp. HL-93]SBR45701.1 GntR family transcriptional regulator / MocR family aminotransferase [Halomonas sp. HL-93]SNY98407.1 GntR family transcriptional regulator / MocR family aminotransferase [Halomonas sp. hl-4]